METKNKDKKNPMREIFGMLKDWKIDSQKMKDELRKESAQRDRKLSKLMKKLKKYSN